MSTTLGASGPDRVESSGADASTQATQTENETTITFNVDTASLDVEPSESFDEVLTRDFSQVERVTVEEADDS